MASEQQRLGRARVDLEGQLEALQTSQSKARTSLAAALDFVQNCGAAYQQAPASIRRMMNQALFSRLLVEDEEGLRALNARGLASRGYTVLEASNGVEALEVIDKHGAVDLVVSDVVMPEMDGPTLLKELRRRDPAVKIIFVSGYAEEAFAKNLPSDEAGKPNYAFLAKPFTLKQLVATVKQTLVG